MTSKVHLRLGGAVDHLRLVWQAGETMLESVPFRDDPEGTRYNVLLAVQEMLTNVLRHGYAGADERPVEVRFEATDRGFSAEIRDDGPPFDPVATDVTAIDCAADAADSMPAESGGYGILIAKMVMDGLDYRREGSQNVLRMSKLVEVPATSGTRS